MTRFDDLYLLGGQSAWVDNIRRDWLDDGTLQSLLDQGIRGVTSNPSIFAKAVSSSSAYDAFIAAAEGSDEEVFEQLAVRDVRDACHMFRPVYDASLRERRTGTHRYTDGYVSLEVSPRLAHDTAGTVTAAQRLAATLSDCPNLMIKIPATDEGLPAVTQVLAAGINVNVTLIFSLERYAQVIDAFIEGQERARANGVDMDALASVSSFFVSRVDTAIDPLLPADSNLRGAVALAQVSAAYELFLRRFGDHPTDAQIQRPLWASTSTKNPAYDELLYVDCLVAPESVNTIPDGTLRTYGLRGSINSSVLAEQRAECAARLSELPALGIDLSQVTTKLEHDGVAAFEASYEELLTDIANKRATL